MVKPVQLEQKSVEEFLYTLQEERQVRSKNVKANERSSEVVAASNTTVKKAPKKEEAPSSKVPSKPLLKEAESTNFYDAFGGNDSDDNINIVAVCRQALATQLQINSQFWSNQWKQAGATMQMYAQFAPVVGKATQGDWDAQAQVTQDNGDKARAEGGVMLGLAIMSTAQGAYDFGKSSMGERTGLGIADEGAPDGAPRPAASGAGPAGDAAAEVEGGGDRASRLWDVTKKGAKWFGKAFMESTYNAAQRANMNQLWSQAIINMWYEPHYANIVSTDQKVVGNQESLAKQTEMFAQYYSTQSQRTYDLGSGASQFIETCYNLITSIADNVAATTRQMFQG